MQQVKSWLQSKRVFGVRELAEWRRKLYIVHKCKRVLQREQQRIGFKCLYHDKCAFQIWFTANEDGTLALQEGHNLHCGRDDEATAYIDQLERIVSAKAELRAFLLEDSEHMKLTPKDILLRHYKDQDAFCRHVRNPDLVRALRKKFDNVVNQIKRKLEYSKSSESTRSFPLVVLYTYDESIFSPLCSTPCSSPTLLDSCSTIASQASSSLHG